MNEGSTLLTLELEAGDPAVPHEITIRIPYRARVTVAALPAHDVVSFGWKNGTASGACASLVAALDRSVSETRRGC